MTEILLVEDDRRKKRILFQELKSYGATLERDVKLKPKEDS
jgi:hypothetical protein